MATINRRSFMSATLTTAAGAVGFLYPGVARARSSGTGADALPQDGRVVQTVDGPDPTFACGEVSSISAAGVVLQAGSTVRAVRVDPSATVWKEFDVTPKEIAIGDWLDVKGDPMADGSLQARSGWIFVNIGRRDGIIEQSHGDGLSVRHQSGHVNQLAFSKHLEVIRQHDGSPVPGHISALTPGTSIGAVGLRLEDGTLRATRIWM